MMRSLTKSGLAWTEQCVARLCVGWQLRLRNCWRHLLWRRQVTIRSTQINDHNCNIVHRAAHCDLRLSLGLIARELHLKTTEIHAVYGGTLQN